jgi:hypothetical protein
MRRLVVGCAVAVSSCISLSGCATLQELAAVRGMTFAFSRVSDVRVAGIPIGPQSSFARLSVADASRLAAAIVSKEVPIDLIAHVDATNPAENRVTARLVDLTWKLFVEDRRALEGGLAQHVAVAPGTTADVPLVMRFDLLELGRGGARDLFELALGIAGSRSITKDLRLELSPTVDTSLGPIRYPSPIVVRRAAD